MFLKRFSTFPNVSNSQTSPFKLNEEFVESFSTIKPPFGYNGLGELVYKRTYSRKKLNGSQEQWFETIERVVNGTFSMQKKWAESKNLAWNEQEATYHAEEMYRRIFEMKFLPPGRGLWAMGSPTTSEKGLFAALNNCGFVSTENLHQDPVKPFAFLMDASMLGVGVGFDTKGAKSFVIPGPNRENSEETFVIPDSREGWVQSLQRILESHFLHRSPIKFDYGLIRPAGEEIKGFGGISAGSDCLFQLHKSIEEILGSAQGHFISSRIIVDLMNLIGKCVVSGNLRRTAEIAFGDPNDEEYIHLKNYSQYPERSAYGWTSNNSVFAELGTDYRPLAQLVQNNGEPGFAWLQNMQQYDRMNGIVTNTDYRARGGNPCLEQTLEPYELCCLVETFPSHHHSYEDFEKSLEYAFLYAKTVTLGTTHWEEANSVMERNRRIGCSISGIAQFLGKHSIETLRSWCERGYSFLTRYDVEVSQRMGIPKSIKKTCIKPSGTVSLLAGSTPGMHYPLSRYYLRRVRLSKHSELLGPLKRAGYHLEDALESEESVIVSFPVDAGEGLRKSSSVSMWEQLGLAAFLQKHWADNQVSCTVSFNPSTEGEQISHALDIFQYQLKGVSFMPLTTHGYVQVPYEEISEETYTQLCEGLSPIQWDLHGADSTPELFCDADKCSL